MPSISAPPVARQTSANTRLFTDTGIRNRSDRKACRRRLALSHLEEIEHHRLRRGEQSAGELVADPLREPWSDELVYDRRIVDVGLPLSPNVAVRVDGVAGSWSRGDDQRLVLHPLPNRPTRFRFSLVNDSTRPRKVTVRLAAPPAAMDFPGVRVLSERSTSQLLANLGDQRSTPPVKDMELPGDPQPIAIPLPDLAAPEKEGEGGLLPLNVEDELLLLITDQQSRQTTVERISFRPQRPRRYIRAQASYRSAEQRCTIRLAPRDATVLPDSGVPVQAYFDPPLPLGRQARLAGVVKDAEVVLEAEIPRGSQPVNAYVDIDGYPRAFIFRVDPTADAERIPEVTAAHQIRIASPESKATLKAPRNSIRVQFQIDADQNNPFFYEAPDYLITKLFFLPYLLHHFYGHIMMNPERILFLQLDQTALLA